MTVAKTKPITKVTKKGRESEDKTAKKKKE